jgi:hypothetical protein
MYSRLLSSFSKITNSILVLEEFPRTGNFWLPDHAGISEQLFTRVLLSSNSYVFKDICSIRTRSTRRAPWRVLRFRKVFRFALPLIAPSLYVSHPRLLILLHFTFMLIYFL